MRTPLARAVVILLCGAASVATAVSPNVRISQVYGGAGTATAAYNADYVELFNFSGVPVSLDGWSLQYASSTGPFTAVLALPAGESIQPCGYYLVALAGGAAGAPLPVWPDVVGTIALSATSGKVVLVRTNAAVGACPPSAAITVDLVGYGAAATCAETLPTPTLSAATAALRGGGGMTDTDNNSLDFTVAAPAPRGSASAGNPDCRIVATEPASWGVLKTTYR
ncbi:MAG: lamin tail domain-containing protein [Candidatus Krumholzibacteriia bacterium]